VTLKGNRFRLGFSTHLPPLSHAILATAAVLVALIVFASPVSAATFTVTFTETGLPAGTTWSVTLGVSTMTSAASTITFPTIAGGTAYTYSVQNSTTAACETLCTYHPAPASGSTGVITGNLGVSVAFTQRYYLTVVGGSGGADGQGWFNVGSVGTASSLGVFGRVSGAGFRIASYNVDGGSNMIPGVFANVLVPVTMSSPHTVTFTKVAQYQVTFDSGAAAAFVSITTPTLVNDNYWYDSGTSVNLVLNGAWGRSGGDGFRLKSFALNGGLSTQVATTGTVAVLSLPAITAPQAVTTVTTAQYLLTLDGGASGALASIQVPPITGDSYWYDSGTVVQYVGHAVYGRSGGAGERVSGWWLDTSPANPLLTSGSFAASVTMSAPHAIHTTTVAQYQVALTGNFSILSMTSPTVAGDNYWYDGGTAVNLVLNGTYSRSDGSGYRMTGYSIDGGSTVPVLTRAPVQILSLADLGSPQTVAISSVTQVQVALDSTSLAALSSITAPTISGDNYWYDTGTSFTLTLNGVWGRASGSGIRLASYSLDGGSPVTVASNHLVDVLAQTDLKSPQTLTASDVVQYMLTVNGGSGIAFTVSPPIAGDVGWYDSGTSLQVTSAGFYGRSSGVGQRVISWDIDGAPATSVAAGGAVMTGQITMSAPHTVDFSSVTQYEVTLNVGATMALRSISLPTIGGDDYWYDSGSGVSVVLNGTGSQGPGARYRLVDYSINGATPLAFEGTGPVDVLEIASLGAPESIAATITTQYLLTVSGGNGVSISLPSPTGDGWYDNGTGITISSSYVWNVTEGQSRQTLSAYGLDGATVSIRRAQTGTFTTPTLVMSKPQTLQFNSVTQYLVSFVFTDSTGANRISPSGLELTVQGLGTISLANDSEWLDSGSTFTITEVLWNGVDVKPTSVPIYTVDRPMINDVATRIYSSSITVVDLFGLPVAGADGKFTFANGTTVHEKSGSDGTIKLDLIPLGTFQAVISNLGASSSFAGDASTQPQSQVKVPLSVPLLAVILVAIIAILGGLFYLSRRRASGRAKLEEELKQEPKVSPTLQAKQEPVVKPLTEPKGEPIAEAKQEPTVGPIVEPKDEPIAETKEESIIEPVTEQKDKPIADPKEEPIVEPMVETKEEPTTTVVEPVVELETKQEPIVETKEEPIAEATVEPNQEPTVEPIVETKEEAKDESEPISPPIVDPLMKRDEVDGEAASL
jgi:hypothetical protein